MKQPNQIKLLISLLAAVTLASSVWAETGETDLAGEWSAPVGGLRGRLIASEVKPVDGTRIAYLYFELENVSDGRLLLNRLTPKVNLTDAMGKTLKQPDQLGGMEPEPYTVVLPPEARLRLRISLDGWK